MFPVSSKYGLVLLESIRGMVQIEPKEQCFSTTDHCTNRPLKSKVLFNGDTNWRTEQFYVNQLHRLVFDESVLDEKSPSK